MRAEKSANQTLHQTPASPAVLAGAGGGAGELAVRITELTTEPEEGIIKT